MSRRQSKYVSNSLLDKDNTTQTSNQLRKSNNKMESKHTYNKYKATKPSTPGKISTKGAAQNGLMTYNKGTKVTNSLMSDSKNKNKVGMRNSNSSKGSPSYSVKNNPSASNRNKPKGNGINSNIQHLLDSISSRPDVTPAKFNMIKNKVDRYNRHNIRTRSIITDNRSKSNLGTPGKYLNNSKTNLEVSKQSNINNPTTSILNKSRITTA